MLSLYHKKSDPSRGGVALLLLRRRIYLVHQLLRLYGQSFIVFLLSLLPSRRRILPSIRFETGRQEHLGLFIIHSGGGAAGLNRISAVFQFSYPAPKRFQCFLVIRRMSQTLQEHYTFPGPFLMLGLLLIHIFMK